MEENLAQKSIKFALQCKWKEAIKCNLEILKSDPEDIDCLNRLAKAYYEIGEINNAKSTSKKVLKIDPINNIAINALQKFNLNNHTKVAQNKKESTSFIEIRGKTKITTLINLGSEKICSCLSTGDEVFLVTHAHKVSVINSAKEYVGKLTDDLSARLRVLIKNGNKYEVIVKSVSKNCIKVFIKGDVVSFPVDKSESLSEFSS